MKSMKEYLTGISLCIALFIAGGCSNENDIASGGNNEDGKTVLLTIRATATRFEGLPETEKSDAPLTRTPTEDGNNTQFNTGDAIGIFAIKDGAIVDNINNSKLTYDAATKNWNPDASTSLYYYASVSYIAYYPYKDGITIDATQTTDEIIASLAANSKLQPGTNQATAADYTACDLMTASGKAIPDTGNPGKQVLTLSFKHQFSLLVLVPRVFVECYAPTAAGFVYYTGAKSPIADSNANSVTLNGVTPYEMSDGSYRAIVNPTTTSSTLNGSYKTAKDRTMDYKSNAYATGFAGGSCYLLNVDSPLHGSGSVERALAPGDFVFQNESQGRIEVYPGDGPLTKYGNTRIPDYNKAIGIVVTCDKNRMTDTGCNAKNWNHAYVMGFYQEAECTWGPEGVNETVIPLIGRDEGEFDMNGYTETEAMLAERESKGDLDNYGVFKMLKTYRMNVGVPAGLSGKRSPWFLGSSGQWFDVYLNLGGRSPKTFGNSTDYSWIDNNGRSDIWNKINNQLNKVGNPLTNVYIGTSVCYWCSSQHTSSGFSWAAWFGRANETFTFVDLGRHEKEHRSDLNALRPFFAF